jgi:hypothetical protein
MLSHAERRGNINGRATPWIKLDKLRALEREVEREWWWLSGALHAVAQARSGDTGSFRELQEQARNADRRRVEIATRIAALIGPEKVEPCR